MEEFDDDWISVKDSLPEFCDDLCFPGSESIPPIQKSKQVFTYNKVLDKDAHPSFRKYAFGCDQYIQVGDRKPEFSSDNRVTHWKYPKRPKE